MSRIELLRLLYLDNNEQKHHRTHHQSSTSSASSAVSTTATSKTLSPTTLKLVGHMFQAIVNPATLWGIVRLTWDQSIYSEKSLKHKGYQYLTVLIDVLLSPMALFLPKPAFEWSLRMVHWSAWLVYQYAVHKVVTMIIHDLGISGEWFGFILLWDHEIPPLFFLEAVKRLSKMAHDELTQLLNSVREDLDHIIKSSHDTAMAWLNNNWDAVQEMCLENIGKWTGWNLTEKFERIAPLNVDKLDVIVSRLQSLATTKIVDDVFVQRVIQHTNAIKRIDKRNDSTLASWFRQGHGGQPEFGLNNQPVLRDKVKEKRTLDTEALQFLLIRKLSDAQMRYEVGRSPPELDELLAQVKGASDAKSPSELLTLLGHVLSNKHGSGMAVLRTEVRKTLQPFFRTWMDGNKLAADTTGGKTPDNTLTTLMLNKGKEEDRNSDQLLDDLSAKTLGELVTDETENNGNGESIENVREDKRAWWKRLVGSDGGMLFTSLLSRGNSTNGTAVLTNGTAVLSGMMFTSGTEAKPIGTDENDSSQAACDDVVDAFLFLVQI
jgi:hypothetical protein